MLAGPVGAKETIKVGLYQYEPVIFLDSSGNPQGFAVDMLEYIAQEDGWELEYVPCYWPDGLEMLEKGEIDILPAIAYSGERSGKYDFTNESLLLDWGQIYTGPDAEIDSILDLDGKNVAGLEEGIYYLDFKPYSEKFGLDCKMVPVKDYATVFEYVESNKADAGIVPRSSKPAKGYDVYESSIVFSPIELRFAVPKNRNQDILEGLDKHLIATKGDSGSIYYQSYERWLGDEEHYHHMPEWLKSVMGIGGGLLLLFGAMSVALKAQVRRKTARLSDMNKELILEINERKKAEEALRASEEKYSTIVEMGNDGIYIVQDDIVKYANSKMAEIAAYPLEEIVGTSPFTFIEEECRGLVIERHNKRMNGDRFVPQKYEVDIISGTGCKIPTEVNVSLIQYEGRPAAMVILRDITEHRYLEEKLEFEREQLLSIFDGIDGIVYVVDPETHEVLFSNKFAKDCIGKDPTGGICYRELHGLEQPCVFCTNETILEEKGKVYSWEYYDPIISRHMILSDRIIKWPDGRDVRFELGIDITDLKEAEEALRASQKKYSMLVEKGNDGIAIIQDGTFKFGNPRMLKMLGYSLEEVIDKPFFNHVSDEYREIVTERYGKRLAGEPNLSRKYEISLISKAGTCIPVEINPSLIEHEGRPAVMAILRDITERKRAEKIAKEKYQVEAASLAKSEFLANMSHELRTPLNSVIGFSDVLMAQHFGPLNEKQKKYVNNISKSGSHLLNLINDILDLSKIEAGKMEIHMEEFPVRSLVEEVKNLFTPLSEEKNLGLAFRLSPEVRVVEADKTKLKQILVNLVSNAVKFTPEGGSVAVDIKTVGDNLQARVTDTGIGISEADQDKVFQPFMQVGKFESKEHQGTGLGLKLVKSFVEMHGGKIWLESYPKKGSSFTFTVPLKQKAPKL